MFIYTLKDFEKHNLTHLSASDAIFYNSPVVTKIHIKLATDP